MDQRRTTAVSTAATERTEETRSDEFGAVPSEAAIRLPDGANAPQSDDYFVHAINGGLVWVTMDAGTVDFHDRLDADDSDAETVTDTGASASELLAVHERILG